MMRSTLFITGIYLICVCEAVPALQIVRPGEGEKIYAGTEMEVILEPQPGEEWKELIFQLSPLKDKVFSDGYRETLLVPPDLVGEHYLVVVAVDDTGKAVLLQRKVIIVMPADVQLERLSVIPERITLYKMSNNCPPADRLLFETETIGVHGECSDGIRRKLASSASGTTYISSNKMVATVSENGVIVAQGLGSTTITVINGAMKAETHVVVRPCTEK